MEIIQQWQFLGAPRPELLKDEVLAKCKSIGITSLQSYVTWAEIEKIKDKTDFSSYDPLVAKLKKHNLKWTPFLILGPEYATPKWFQESEESVFFKCLEHGKESKIQSIWNPHLPKYVARFLKIVSEHYQDKAIFESILLGISGNWGEAIFPSTGGFNRNFHTHPGFWCADREAVKKHRSLKNKDFPDLREDYRKKIKHSLINVLAKSPDFLKKGLKSLLLKASRKKFLFSQETTAAVSDEDFAGWYAGEMTNFAEIWLKLARQYFPENKIYLVTGGIGEISSGADFTAQAKLAKKYQAGIRITNQTNDYGQSFIMTRQVSSAARFYGIPFVTEEAAVLQTKEGAVMRIFDAVSSGAAGLYCKNFISTGQDDPCVKKNLAAGQITEAGKELKENLHWFDSGKPEIATAVFFPGSSNDFYNKAARLRENLDFDLVDERMAKDGALKNYKHCYALEEILADKIKDVPGEKTEGVYATKFQDKIMYYNSNNYKVKKGLVEIGANSIGSSPL